MRSHLRIFVSSEQQREMDGKPSELHLETEIEEGRRI